MDDLVNQHKEDADRNELFIWACTRGLLLDAVHLLDKGASANIKDKAGLTPLHYAASHGHHEIVEFLSTRGVELDAEDPQGRSPLHFACAGGHLATATFLASRSVWMDSYDSADDTPLHLAARCGSPAICKLLIDAKAKVDLPNKRGLTPFGEALVNGHVEAAELLLSLGANHGVRPRGFTLLHLVCGLGQDESAALLLGPKVKCDPRDSSNPEGLTPLHAAAMAGSLACVELLLKHGALAADVSISGLQAVDMIMPPIQVENQEHDLEIAEIKKRLLTAAGEKLQSSSSWLKGHASTVASMSSKSHKKQETVKEETPEEKFGRLPRAEQLRKVEAYSRMDETARTQILSLKDDARKLLEELHKAGQLLECMKGVLALKSDSDFQDTLVDPAVKEAMQVIKQTNDTSRYKDDSRVQSLMAKMNKLQAVMRANGNPKITLEDVLATKSGPGSVVELQKRVEVLSRNIKLMRDRAVVALGGKAADEKAVHIEEVSTVLNTTAVSSKSSASVPAASDADAASLLAEAHPQLPVLPITGKGWWLELRTALWSQLKVNLVVMLIMFIAFWYMGLLPGQMSQNHDLRDAVKRSTEMKLDLGDDSTEL
ncbi:hypothetical protein CEUSTIGMA_g417.t1 [Chlamydomonas eustigma]|uniref:Uncharacterized protein n=1 Tax=Chlamydomonas eustigma TaxID=1157962 RepID=A0A250WQM4_9CHLO|nr:hypothetical protein CEUSTIGMA_g417.t1 [Chlamydomonas eustigma]|eukprot:GAX72962.1 hypothetical protein CEUSTIGMA_g417.t1 [Chlamydomonas eustigma]